MTESEKEVAKGRLQGVIRKKCWPEMFELVLSGKKNAEIRLADFAMKPGDTLVLEEWNPKTKEYTGRKLQRKVKNLVKVDVAKMNSLEDIRKNGLYLIELEGERELEGDKSRLRSTSHLHSKELV